MQPQQRLRSHIALTLLSIGACAAEPKAPTNQSAGSDDTISIDPADTDAPPDTGTDTAAPVERTLLFSETFSGTSGTPLADRPLDNGHGGSTTAVWSDLTTGSVGDGVGWSTTDPTTGASGGVALGPRLHPDRTYAWSGRVRPPADCEATSGVGWNAWTGLGIGLGDVASDADPAGVTVWFTGTADDCIPNADLICVRTWRTSDEGLRFCASTAPVVAEDYDEAGFLPVEVTFSGAGTEVDPLWLAVSVAGERRTEVWLDDLSAPLGGHVGWRGRTGDTPAHVDDLMLEVLEDAPSPAPPIEALAVAVRRTEGPTTLPATLPPSPDPRAPTALEVAPWLVPADLLVAHEAAAEFAGIQGTDDWTYVYDRGAGWTPMTWAPSYLGTGVGFWNGDPYWCVVGATQQVSCGGGQTARVWTSPFPDTRTVRVSGDPTRGFGAELGDGVRIHIELDGSVIWGPHSATEAGHTHDLEVDVPPSGQLRFVLDSGDAGDNSYDTVLWAPVLTIPESVSIAWLSTAWTLSALVPEQRSLATDADAIDDDTVRLETIADTVAAGYPVTGTPLDGAPWRRNYHGVYAAEVVDQDGDKGLFGILHGENKNEYAWFGGCDHRYDNTLLVGDWTCPEDYAGYRADLGTYRDHAPSYFAVVDGAFVALGDPAQPLQDAELGPITWPSTGFVSPEGRKLARGHRHPSSVQDDTHLYVFYKEELAGSTAAHRSGIKVVRADLGGALAPSTFMAWDGADWSSPALPAGFDRTRFADFVDQAGGPTALLADDLGVEVNRFTVARVRNTDLFVGVAEVFDLDAFATRLTVRLSDDLVHWSRPAIIPGSAAYWGSGLHYPSLADAQLRTSAEVDAEGFYVLGAAGGAIQSLWVELDITDAR